MAKPKLLVLTSTYPRWQGDSEPGFVHELCRRLTNNFEITVLAPHAPGAKNDEVLDGVSVKRFRYAPGNLEQLAYEGGLSEKIRQKLWRVALVPFFLIAQYIAVWVSVRRLKPDVIHAHWIFPQAFVAVLVNKVLAEPVPVLCTVHGADWYRLKGFFWNWVKRITLSACSCISPVSETLRRDMHQSGLVKGRISEAMPMGIEVPGEVTPLSRRDCRDLFFVGRLVPKKGLSVLLEALSILDARGGEFSLRIAGGGEDLARYRAKVQSLRLQGKVTFLGAVDHRTVYSELAKTAVCIVPSLAADDGDKEGLGLVPLEALACEAQVLASDIEVFTDAFSNATSLRYFVAGDGESLARELYRLMADIRAGEARTETSDILLPYQWATVAEVYARKMTALVDDFG